MGRADVEDHVADRDPDPRDLVAAGAAEDAEGQVLDREIRPTVVRRLDPRAALRVMWGVDGRDHRSPNVLRSATGSRKEQDPNPVIERVRPARSDAILKARPRQTTASSVAISAAGSRSSSAAVTSRCAPPSRAIIVASSTLRKPNIVPCGEPSS